MRRHAAACAVILFATSALGDEVVLVSRDGGCERTTSAAFEPARRSDVVGLWAWSEATAPRRFLARDASFAREPEPDRLAVACVLRSDATVAGLELIAGPTAMWTEVPEALMPRWRVPQSGKITLPRPAGEPWRARLSGPRSGSAWVEIEPGRTSIQLTAVGAESRTIRLVAPGHALVRPRLRVVARTRGVGDGVRVLALFDAAGDTVTFSGLPFGPELIAVATADGLAPAVQPLDQGRSGILELRPGGRLLGRVTTEDGQAVAHAAVGVETWAAADLPLQLPYVAVADADGGWKISGLPRGKAILAWLALGYAPQRREIEVVEGSVDVGALVVAPSERLTLKVVDEGGVPLAGAIVKDPEGFGGTSDAEGQVMLTASPGVAIRVTVTAEGFVPKTEQLLPPFSEVRVLALQYATSLRARLVGADLLPAVDASVTFETGSSQTPIDCPEGRLQADIPPKTAGQLVVRSPSSEELRLDIAPGEPGEIRDLGELILKEGLVVTGQVVSGSDGAPVAGARVWALRVIAHGEQIAWMMNEVLETRSDREGGFRLAGLRPGPALIRVDASGFARTHLDIDVKAGGDNDVGLVAVDPGAQVRLLLREPAPASAVARLDLRGDQLDFDLLTAPVEGREAVFEHVPRGRFELSVSEDENPVCQATAEVTGRKTTKVECTSSRVRVHGRVTIGDRPAPGGSLSFVPASAGQRMEGIQNFVSSGGLRQQRCFLGRRRDVNVPVRDDGSFVAETLTPGSWRVTYGSPSATAPAAAQSLDIPRVEKLEAVLRFDAGVVAGRVVDEDGEPVREARVRTFESGAFAISNPAGEFQLVGLAPGRYTVQARSGDEVSQAASVVLEADRTPRPIELVVSGRNSVELKIRVSSGGAALVLLELDATRAKLLTTDAGGALSVRVEAPFPARVRLAANANGEWFLGEWMSLEQARQGINVEFGETGTLTVTSEETEAALDVVAQGGWSITGLMMRLGLRLSVAPRNPQTIQGLPVGTYQVSAGSTSRVAQVRSGREETLRLP